MKKLNLYLYPNAKDHAHDLAQGYENTVPLSKYGIERYCNLVTDPKIANFFYMGQFSRNGVGEEVNNAFSPSNFKYFEEYKDKHIVDLEGEGGLPIPKWLFNSIITVNGPPSVYEESVKNIFVRPTFSKLLINLARNRFDNIEYNYTRKASFKGVINHWVRYFMFTSLQNSNNVVLFQNQQWSGPSEVGSKIQLEYEELMKKTAFTLCPRGSGIDSTRLWEVCFFGRIPILISDTDYMMVGNNYFVPKILLGTSPNKDKFIDNINEILSLSENEIKIAQIQNREYFENFIRPLIQDPTKVFLYWLIERNLI